MARQKIALPGPVIVQPLVGCFYGQAAAIGHRVARIDAQIEQCIFQLRGIDFALRVRDPDDLRNRIRHQAKTGLTFAYFFFCTYAFSSIAKVHHMPFGAG